MFVSSSVSARLCVRVYMYIILLYYYRVVHTCYTRAQVRLTDWLTLSPSLCGTTRNFIFRMIWFEKEENSCHLFLPLAKASLPNRILFMSKHCGPVFKHFSRVLFLFSKREREKKRDSQIILQPGTVFCSRFLLKSEIHTREMYYMERKLVDIFIVKMIKIIYNVYFMTVCSV